jgi:hypothetical protein
VDGELQGDYALRFSIPEGEQVWTGGWGVFGPVGEFAGKGLRFFECQARTWFENHMYDFRMSSYEADRGFDDIPLRFEVSPALERVLEGPP